MGNKHCKDVTEDLFVKEDHHFQLDDKPKALPELEPLTAQHLREKRRLGPTGKQPQDQES